MRLTPSIKKLLTCGSLALVIFFGACEKEVGSVVTPPPTEPPPVISPIKFDINSINDTYSSLASFSSYAKWGSYNVHDPAIIREGIGIIVIVPMQVMALKFALAYRYVNPKTLLNGFLLAGYSTPCPGHLLTTSLPMAAHPSIVCGPPVS